MQKLIDLEVARAYAEERWPSPVVRRHIDALLDGCPKVEAEPPRHGEWVYGKTNYYDWRICSECLMSQDQCGCFNYCPNCGAKMDGGK